MDEKSKGSLFFLQLSEMHSSRIEFNEEEHIESFKKDRLYCEEVTGQ
jgi:hypothetical protein